MPLSSASSAASASQPDQVRGMFGRIAGRYDLLNRLLSARRDVAWRRHALSQLSNPPGLLVDLACGTYDVGLEALTQGLARQVIGLDFCLPMLVAGERKRRGKHLAASAGDCLRLPLADGCARTVTISYGWRNVADQTQAVAEMARILEPGGELLILEFFRPQRWWPRVFYATFGRWIFPAVGGLIAGDTAAYRYLHDSVQRFLRIDEALTVVTAQGFTQARAISYFGGISHAILARKG